MRLGRSRKVNAGFLVVWMTFWLAAIFVAVWMLGSAALRGELGAGLFLAIWIAAAGFGLVSAARKLVQLLVTGPPDRPDTRPWDDGMDPPPVRPTRPLPSAAADRIRADGKTSGGTEILQRRSVFHGSHPFRGPLFMVLSTGSYMVNDTMMKLATEGLPPYEVLVLRGLAAVAWGLPLLLLAGYGRQLPLMFEGRVVLRNLCETAGDPLLRGGAGAPAHRRRERAHPGHAAPGGPRRLAPPRRARRRACGWR